MKINVAVLSDVVNKGVKTEVKRLKQTSNQIKGLSIPSDFEYAGKLKACSGKIDRVVSELSGVGNALAGVIEKYKRAEQINANILADVQKGVGYMAMNDFVRRKKQAYIEKDAKLRLIRKKLLEGKILSNAQNRMSYFKTIDLINKYKEKENLNGTETFKINNTVNVDNMVVEKIGNIEKTISNNKKIENTTSGKDIQNLNESLKNKQEDLKEDIIKTIPKDLDDIEKMRMIYLKLNQTMGYLNNLGHSTGSESKKIKIDEDVFDVSKMNASQILGGKWTKIYAELLENSGIDSNKISIKSSEKGTWLVGNLGKDKIVIAYELFDKNKKGFFITNEKELKELLAKNAMEEVLQIVDEKREISDKEIDQKIGYNKNQVKELMDEFIKKYSIEANSEMSIKDKLNNFIKFINNKEITIIDAFAILKIYIGKNDSNIFGKNATIQSDLYINGKDITDVITITGKDDKGKTYTYYMYSKNNSELIYTDNINKVINGEAVIKNAETKK